MTIEMIPLKNLKTSDANPRKAFDDDAIVGLAQSIKTDGLLQNLVVTKKSGRAKTYTIVSGERRYRALCQLVETGDLPADLTVPAEIRTGIDQQEALRIAAVENIQRQDLSPLEEAQALSVLVENGDSLDEIVAQSGLSERTIRRRLALLGLSARVKEALEAGTLSLVQAEAFCLGSEERQDEVLDHVLSGWRDSAESIRQWFIGGAPTKAMAIFDTYAYTGTFTTDLFADDEATYFDDVDQFRELQRAAAQALTTELEAEYDWAEFVEGYVSHYLYRDPEEGERGGAIVCLTPRGEVDVFRGRVRKEVDPSIRQSAAPKPKASYARPVREYVAMHKSGAVQVELLAHPRIAKEVLAAHLLERANVHACWRYLSQSEGGAGYASAMDAEAAALCKAMGIAVDEEPVPSLFRACYFVDAIAIEYVEALDDAMLERLVVFLSALQFGQRDCGEIDTSEVSIFNHIAGRLGTDMRKHWVPDLWFLGRRTLAQLQAILKESGLTRFVASSKTARKADLAAGLADAFATAREGADGNEMPGADWLPEVMSFPAVDPNAVTEDEDVRADKAA